MRAVALKGVENVRDLGGIAAGGGRVVTRGLLFRGAQLGDMTDADQRTLFGERGDGDISEAGGSCGIRCVIDLRCGWEREAKPPVEVPGVDHRHIPFYDLEKVGIEYTETGDGGVVVGRDVACDPPRFYRSLVNPLTVRQIAQAVDCVFAQACAGRPVLWHCSGGKDRAGVLAALVLAVLGASPDDIMDDYLLTNESRDKQYDALFARFLRLAGGDEQRAHELVVSHRARPETLASFYAAVDERCGSLERFIRDQLGIDDGRRARIREACTIEA